jgi:hypothetical protein
MSAINQIKSFFASKLLEKELRSNLHTNNAVKFNFEEIKTIGILVEASNAVEFELVKKYVLSLREAKKKVKVLGFFDTKQLPPMTYSKLEYDFFIRKETNWMGKPTVIVAKNFIAEPFDLLIDLNAHDHFCLKYIASLSKANFKIGKYSDSDVGIYDMMISSDNTDSVDYLLKQINTYLLMLNQK